MADTNKPDPGNDSDPNADRSPPEDAPEDAIAAPDAEKGKAPQGPGDRAANNRTDGEPEDTAPQPPSGTDHAKRPGRPVQPSARPPVPVGEPRRRGGFAPALAGGILAAGLGFFAARTEVLDTFLPGGSKTAEMTETLAELRANDAGQADMLARLRAEIAAIGQPDLAPITAQLSALQAEISPLRAESAAQQADLRDLEARLKPLAARLEALEKRPMTQGASQEAMDAYDREMGNLQQAMAAQRAEVETMIDRAREKEAAARALEQNAAAAARRAGNQATLARLLVALDNGDAYGALLSELSSAGVDIPDALDASSGEGVATLAALDDAFAPAARAALSAARAEGGDGGGLGGFLQRQLGARSVQPRQGDDPDAILSRAQAAVTGGDLSTALAEIAALPPVARERMQGWADMATTRLTALGAAQDLAQSLNTN